MAILKTDYKDDILDTSQNTKRKYAMTENQDNTVSFDDETEYTQEGDNFGAQDINATNAQVNTNTGAIADINDNLTALLNKVSYQNIDVSSATKYADVQDLISASIADNKCPYIMCNITVSGTIINDARVNYVRSGFASTNVFTFSNILDRNSIITIDILDSNTITGISGTSATISNAKLYY